MFFSSAHLNMFYILYLEIQKVVQVKILCKTWMGSIFYQGSEIKILGKKELRDQNNGKKIGISGSRIYHVTTLRYTCVFVPRILAFFPALWGFYSQVYDHFLTNAHIYAHKKAHLQYMRYKQACVYGVAESSRIRGTKLYRQQKTPSCTMSCKVTSVGRNGRVNFEQVLVRIPHCLRSNGGCWLPDNEFVGIRGLSLERLWPVLNVVLLPC